MIKEYKYDIETIMGTVYKVKTNEPTPRIAEGSKFRVEGSMSGATQDIVILLDNKKLNFVRELQVSVHAALPQYRSFSMKIINPESLLPVTRNPVINNTGKFYIADRNGIPLDKYGNVAGETRYFNRRSDASNSLNKRKWAGATVKQA